MFRTVPKSALISLSCSPEWSQELQAEYLHLYSPAEISEYWSECAPANGSRGAAPPPAPQAARPAQPAPAAQPVKSQPWGAGGSKLRF